MSKTIWCLHLGTFGYLGAAMWSGSHWSFGRWMLVCPLPLDMSGPKFLVQGLFWKVEWPSSWHPHEPLSFSSQKELGSGGRRNYYHGAKKDSYLDETLQMQLLSEEIWRDLQAPTLQVAIGKTEVKRYLKTWFAIWQHMLQWNSSIPFYQVLQFEKTVAWGSRLGGFGPRLGLTLRSRGLIFHGIHGISWQLVWRTKVFTIIASDANSEVECQVFSGEVEIAGEIYIPQDGPGSGSRADLCLVERVNRIASATWGGGHPIDSSCKASDLHPFLLTKTGSMCRKATVFLVQACSRCAQLARKVWGGCSWHMRKLVFFPRLVASSYRLQLRFAEVGPSETFLGCQSLWSIRKTMDICHAWSLHHHLDGMKRFRKVFYCKGLFEQIEDALDSEYYSVLALALHLLSCSQLLTTWPLAQWRPRWDMLSCRSYSTSSRWCCFSSRWLGS